MRVIPHETKVSLVKVYLANPDLSYQAVADQGGCSASGLHNWVTEFETNDGVIKEAQIGGFRWSSELPQFHCEICQLIYQLGHCISNPKLAEALNQHYSIDVKPETVRQYRLKHDLPHNCKDKGKKSGDWAKIEAVIDENGQIRPSARAQVEAGLVVKDTAEQAGKHYSNRFRTKMVYKVVKDGMSVKAVSKKYDVDGKTIYYWVGQYKKEGRLTRKKRAKNRVKFVLSDYPLLEAARSYPELHCYALKIWLENNHQLNCSVKRIQDYLLSHHIKRPLGDKKSAQKILSSAAPEHYIIAECAKNDASDVPMSSSWKVRLKWLKDGIPWRVKAKLVTEVISYWKTFRQCFGSIKDHRDGHKKAGATVVMLFVILLSVMVAAGTTANVVRFVTSQRLKWLRVIVGEEAIDKFPSETSIQRITRYIDVQDLGQCAIEFTKLRREQLGLPMTGLTIAWDMKTSRGSKDGPDSDYLYTATYMDHQTRETLALVPTGRLAKETKTLLDTIDAELVPIKGNMLTADALHGKPIVAEMVTKHGGDYFLPVKEKQKILPYCHLVFETYDGYHYDKLQQQDQKRPSTTRTCIVSRVPEYVRSQNPEWKNLQTIIFYKVVDPTRPKQNKKSKTSKKYHQDDSECLTYRVFLSSRTLTAEMAIQIIREHWGIEENHNILDVTMGEDHHQARKDNAALVWAIMKRLGLNELFRSRGKEPISGAMNYSHSCIWHLFAQLTQFHKKYPQYAKHFDFKK